MKTSKLAGMEVPIIGMDSSSSITTWFQVSVSPTTTSSEDEDCVPTTSITTDNAASCSVINIHGDSSPIYLFWRIDKNMPYALELLHPNHNPSYGLRITFPYPLAPFAHICKFHQISNSTSSSKSNPSYLLLYAFTVTGVAYLFKVDSNFSTYDSCSIFPPKDLTQFNLESYISSNNNDFSYETITAVTATDESLIVGKNDGSVSCFQIAKCTPNELGFVCQLRDAAGMTSLWGFLPRRVGAVQDLMILEVAGHKILFVLHVDGVLRAWHLFNHRRLLCYALPVQPFSGATWARLFVGEANYYRHMIPLAIQSKDDFEVGKGAIYLYPLHFTAGDSISLFMQHPFRKIPFKAGELIDIKLTPNKIWLLKGNGLIVDDLLLKADDMDGARYYKLQEWFVADQLFQITEHSSEHLFWISHSILSTAKDQIVPFVSSIFMRRLLHPGVYHNSVLRTTLQDYNKRWTDSDFQSLTVDGIKREILSVIENEGGTRSLASVFDGWKDFCTRYYQHWCKNSIPFGIFVESGAVCLIRKQSISLFRSLEDIELLKYGSFKQVGDVSSSVLGLSDVDLGREIIVEVLQCVSNVSRQLGTAASAVCYESLIHESIISSDETVPRLVKILETGYDSSLCNPDLSDLSANSIAWETKLTVHKTLRKFSVDMLLSLHALCNKATAWDIVLNVIESYLKLLVPRKTSQKNDSSEVILNIRTSVLVQATSQVAKVMFESAFDMLVLLRYLVSNSAQIHMMHHEVSRIQLKLVPMIQEIIMEWLIIHIIGTTPSECPSIEDFSSQLSSLQIDGNSDRRSWNKKLGKCEFTLSFILLLSTQSSSPVQSHLSLPFLPDPENCISYIHKFTSWVIWGKGISGEESSSFLRNSTDLALILLRHGQYEAVEILLTVVEAHSQKEKAAESIQDSDGGWCTLFHLLGYSLLARAHFSLHGTLKERKVCEAVHCFFRASAGQGALKALHNLTQVSGLSNFSFTAECVSIAAWKFQYYQWTMQIFEQCNLSEAACQFALAALEQVDEAHHHHQNDEAVTAIKGRLWANVFKLTLDLNRFNDAYCALITNPDVESKYVCLKRLVNVLCEHGALKILCDGELPFIDLSEKVEQELFWKAGRSDISGKPNLYKLLYAFEMQHHNWRRAASYIYMYAARLRAHAVLNDHQHPFVYLQERLNALSAAINALQLVNPAHAWIDTHEEIFCPNEHNQTVGDAVQPKRLRTYVDVEKLENDFVLTSAEYMLSLVNVKWTYSAHKLPRDLVDLLVQTNLYDMAFTVLLKFWKGSGVKRELERVFSAMSLKCYPDKLSSGLDGSDFRKHGLMSMTLSNDGVISSGANPPTHQYKGNNQWDNLEFYLEKYRSTNARLPVIVAETLLCMDPQIELPLWLVHMFRDGRQEFTWGMTGQESSPACLFRIYVDYGRYSEATNLLLDYLQSFATVKPSEIIYRKKPSAAWFPYTTIERLWCQLEESIILGHKVEQCDKLKRRLHGALRNYLELVKADSNDAVSIVSQVL